MDQRPGRWWDELIDRWVRVKSRRLDNATLQRRKLLHTSLIVGVWPLLELQRLQLAGILLLSCLAVLLTQRRAPYASLGLLTLLLFAQRLAVAGAWAVFTAGDGLSALVGRAAGGPRLPWNGKKTWAGSAAFVAAASLALLILLRFEESAITLPHALLIALVVTGCGALAESLDQRLDDNYSVIVVAGVLLHLLLR